MKVLQAIKLDGHDRSADLRGLFDRKLRETCQVSSTVYANNMELFDRWLQEIAQQAFELGQASCK